MSTPGRVHIPPVKHRNQGEGLTPLRIVVLATHVAAIGYALWFILATIPWERLTPANVVFFSALFTGLSLSVYPNFWQPFVPALLAFGTFMWAGATFMLPHSQFAGTPAWQAITLGYIIVGLNADRMFQHRIPNWLSRLSGIPAAGLAVLTTLLAFENLEAGPKSVLIAVYTHYLLSLGLGGYYWLVRRQRAAVESVR